MSETETEAWAWDYLEEAAAELRKARDDNERRASLTPPLVPAGEIAAEVNRRRLEIAEGFTRLAAIDRNLNLPPCYHLLRPEPGQDQEETP